MPERGAARSAAVLGQRALLGLLVAATLVCGPGAADARAEEGPAPETTTPLLPPEDIDFIPDPDSGRPPEDIGDRGGAGQLAMFALVVLGIGLIVALALRESRRARRRSQSPGR